MTTSKSPRRVLRIAYKAAAEALPAHWHRFSPKKFAQPQLLACLVVFVAPARFEIGAPRVTQAGGKSS